MMSTHGEFDHELLIGSSTERFKLVRQDGQAMYTVENFVPQYRNPLTFTQNDWSGGHGEFSRKSLDKYFEGSSIDTTQKGRVFLGPAVTTVLESDDTVLDSAPVDFVWFNSTWVMATAGKIYRLVNEKWTAASTTVAGVTDLCVFETYCFAGCGATTSYKYSNDGNTWTTSTLDDPYANYFFVSPNSAGTAEVLWKAKTPNELKSNTSGLNGGAQWSSVAYIGDASTNITNIFLVNDNLMVGKTDGLWNYDSDGGIHQLRPDLAENISTDNFKYVTEWAGGVYFSEIKGMGEITSRNAYDPMGALHDIGNIGKVGDTVGLASDKDFLYQSIDEGTNTHIYKGREVYREGLGLRWEWCPWIDLGTYTTAALATCQHSTSDKRLWWGYSSGSWYATAYAVITANPTADSNARFHTSGWVRLPYDYGTDAEWSKLWQSAVLEVKGGASGETVSVSYRKDAETSATTCIPAASTNGMYETAFTTELSCNRIQFQLNLASDTNTTTPEVSYFQAKGVEKPVTVRIHEAVYSLGDQPTARAETLRDLLRTARTSTSLIRFADLRYNETTGGTAGTDFVYCVMEPGYPQEVEILHRDKGATPEMGIKVRLREVTKAPATAGDVTNLGTYSVGDILYASSATQLSKLAISTNGKILGSASGLPSWIVPGSLGATAFVVASDASTAIKTFAEILQAAGYPVSVCDSTADEVQEQAIVDAFS